jgi:hypothetical protein
MKRGEESEEPRQVVTAEWKLRVREALKARHGAWGWMAKTARDTGIKIQTISAILKTDTQGRRPIDVSAFVKTLSEYSGVVPPFVAREKTTTLDDRVPGYSKLTPERQKEIREFLAWKLEEQRREGLNGGGAKK